MANDEYFRQFLADGPQSSRLENELLQRLRALVAENAALRELRDRLISAWDSPADDSDGSWEYDFGDIIAAARASKSQTTTGERSEKADRRE